MVRNIINNMEKLSGLQARLMFRRGKNKRTHTLGWCKEVKQANIVILPANLAQDFSKFTKYNSGPLPVLYESKPGEKGCDLAEDSDITKDLPAYKIWRNGDLEKVVDYVDDYDWADMVTFYTGCSFSFDGLLLGNGIPVRSLEQDVEVSMYKSNIQCYGVGPFQCPMVVSMRPIPENQLSLAADITSQMKDVHGAPVHIGDPSVILGPNKDFHATDFGSFAVPQENDVPVFWACGVTNSQAMKEARCPFAITHSPGMMYISDVPQQNYDATKCDEEKCIVIKYLQKGQRYSLLSVKAQEILQNLETAVAHDLGNRGVQHLLVEDDFLKAALALSHASSVALITGFPCRDSDPPDETDGLPGVYTLAAMLQALGIEITLLVDSSGYQMNLDIMKNQVEAGILKTEINIVPYFDQAGQEHHLLNEKGEPKYDVLLATERCGRTSSGRYFTMKGKDISNRLDPIDNIFEKASQRNDVVTIGVGDGGNELGMGKVVDKVRKHIPSGEKIACEVAADLLISAGIANWGCQALAFALFALRRCKIHDRYQRRATGPEPDVDEILGWAVPTVDRERKILEIVEDAGIKDGVRPDQIMSVDGFTFEPTHSEKILEMKKTIEIKF